MLVESPPAPMDLETKILGFDFWQAARELLSFVLFPLIRDAVMRGAETATDELVGFGVGVDWGVVNQAAQTFARRYTDDLANTINGTSQRFVGDAIANWIGSGRPLDELMDELAPMFGRTRAEMIAVTEVTRAFAEGNIVAWRESGVVSGKRWMTAEDELVCPICSPLDGMVVELDSNGFTTEGAVGLTAPPAHVRCRCWLQPIVGEL